MSTVINGRGISRSNARDSKRWVKKMTQQGIQPGLVVLLAVVTASQTYVRNKENVAAKIGAFCQSKTTRNYFRRRIIG